MKWHQRILKKPTTFFSSLAVFCICFYAYTVISAPPSIEATNLRPTNAPVSSEFYPIAGTVSPASELVINGKKVAVQSNGRFTYDFPLKEGDNTITIIVRKNGKSTTKTYSLYRSLKNDSIASSTEAQAQAQDPTSEVSKPDVSEPSDASPSDNASFMDGTFTIGRDIQPGTYKSSNADQCRYEGLSNMSSNIGNILGNGKKEITVTISPEDITFTSQGCGTWTRVD